MRRTGKKIAFTNGCFDILHYGHVFYLLRAKDENHALVVGLNSDASVRRLKGAGRPINNQKERAFVLAALSCVDYVTVFKEDTPINLIRAVQPDVLVKGADWRGRELVGEDVVRKRGGKIKLVNYLRKYSTSRIISNIHKRGRPH